MGGKVNIKWFNPKVTIKVTDLFPDSRFAVGNRHPQIF